MFLLKIKHSAIFISFIFAHQKEKMKIPFKPIEIEDRDIITSFTIPSNYKNCDYSFANICSWRFLYDSEFAIVNGSLLIRFWIENKTRVAYMTPTGQGDLKQAIDLLEADSLEQGHPLCMLGVTPDAKEELEKAIPGGFFYIPERNYFDYIYLREDLATLKGKNTRQNAIISTNSIRSLPTNIFLSHQNWFPNAFSSNVNGTKPTGKIMTRRI